MKFTLSWLKSHLETEASAAEIAAKLTAIGLEVENIDDRAIWQPFILAQVKTAKKHPNADRLQVLQVDIGGKDLLQVVCGAPNARAGLIGVFAPPGAYVPGLDTVLAVGKIREVESLGMMCSESELQLSDEHNGIIDLDPAEFAKRGGKIGMSYAAYAGLDDPIFDVSLTPNRGDCASVYGIARDLAAAGLGRLKERQIPPFKAGKAKSVSARIEDKANCLGFALLRVENVANRAAPQWLRNRLRAVGLNPKTALVDISNYMTLDMGRPLHMFDADKISGAICVRAAKKGESLQALDGKIYILEVGDMVIADDSGVIALPGVMGGESTGCDAETKTVLVESAVWNPLAVARLGRRLGLASDARYRFERGVDPQFMLPGLELAAGLIAEFCGEAKTQFSPIEVAMPAVYQPRQIDFPLSEIKRLTGIDVPAAEAENLLRRLGFAAEKAGAGRLKLCPPSWRPDIDDKADLVEEVIRLYGLDKITPQPLPQIDAEKTHFLTPLQSRSRLARRILTARGYNEALTYSFISAKAAELFGGGKAELKLQNPIAADMSDMRPSLLPALLAALRRNGDRGFADAALCEIGDVYHSAEPAGQIRMAAGVRAGTAQAEGAGRLWRGNAAAVDCFTAKEDALAALEALGMAADKIQIERGAPDYYHPGRSGVLKLGPKIALGYFGELHPQIMAFFGLKSAVCAFELFLAAIPEGRKKAAKTKPPLVLSPFQPIKRDFSFIMADDVAAATVLRAVSGADKKLIAGAQIFDVFAGKGIALGQKALGVEVMIQPDKSSLTDEEIEAVCQKIIAAVLAATKGSLRL